jgi:predicted metal-dependent hydrolase
MADPMTAEDHPIDEAHDAPSRGRTPPIEAEKAEEIFRRGVSLFNGVRYWHAHEAWEELWRAADDEERDFYQGLIQVAAGLLHLQRRNARGARNKLREGLDRLRPYIPTHRGIFVNELVGKVQRTLDDLEAGFLPYLIPPVIRFVELEEPDWSR